MVAGAVRGGLRDCHTMTAVKSLNRMSQVWDNSTVTAVQCWGLAQSVEHAAVNRSVVGSNPTFPVSLSVAGSPERQGVRQHDVHYVLPWPPGLSPGVSNRLWRTTKYIFWQYPVEIRGILVYACEKY